MVEFARGHGSKHANAQFSKYFKDLKNNEAYQNDTFRAILYRSGFSVPLSVVV